MQTTMMMSNVFGFFGFYFEIKTKPKKPKKNMVFIMLGFLNLEPWILVQLSYYYKGQSHVNNDASHPFVIGNN